MPDNRQHLSNAVTNSSNEPPVASVVEDRMRTLKIENGDDDSQERSVGDNPPYPDRPGEPDCIYYLRTGSCGYGSNCRFNHPASSAKNAQINGELPQRVGQPDCGFYLKTGTCKYGSTCKYHHPRDRGVAGPAPLNTLGLPIRQEEKSCPYYMRTYTCKFGAACKFNHPQPATVFPVPGPATKLRALGSADYPSMGMPYSSGLSTWLLPGSPYLSGPRLAGPQSYSPYVVPSSQGSIMAPQGWNTYVGTVPPTSTLGTNFYNPKDPSAFNSVGQMDLLKVSNLPHRPEQPECKYFMSTGSCKYGSECKYHHPKERVAQLAMYSLGPHGLPLRPGEALCSYFQMYGMCKYGPTCKYNHPVGGGYFSSHNNFSFQPPSLPMLNQQPFFPYARNNSSFNSNIGTPRSKSSKINDWIQKPENVEEHKGQLDSKVPDDAKESNVSKD